MFTELGIFTPAVKIEDLVKMAEGEGFEPSELPLSRFPNGHPQPTGTSLPNEL